MEELKSLKHPYISQVNKNIVPIRAHTYINPADPQYYEKVLQYVDPSNPEALYYVGMKRMHEGQREKGLLLLERCSLTKTSYAIRAKAEINKAGTVVNSPSQREMPYGERQIGKSLWKMAAIFCVVLVSLLFIVDAPPIKSALTKLVVPSPEMTVIYETSELPFLLYIDAKKSPHEVEGLLHDKILQLSEQYPNQVIQIYGLYLLDGESEGYPVPIRNPEAKDLAFVVAEYHKAAGGGVTVRYIATEQPKYFSSQDISHIHFGANLVRTALLQYQDDYGKFTDHVQQLVGKYPNNYLSMLPVLQGNTTNWIYDPDGREISSVFRPNLENVEVAFTPVEVVVAKDTHELYIVSGNHILSTKTVGLGKDNLTKVGKYKVDHRVLDPIGNREGIYGSAGLGFGEMAIHGTYDSASIGEDQSLGCVRLRNDDILEIFPLVPKGASVTILDKQSEDFAASMSTLVGWEVLFPEDLNDTNETAIGTVFNWLL